jgi:hypothetical protein
VDLDEMYMIEVDDGSVGGRCAVFTFFGQSRCSMHHNLPHHHKEHWRWRRSRPSVVQSSIKLTQIWIIRAWGRTTTDTRVIQ